MEYWINPPTFEIEICGSYDKPNNHRAYRRGTQSTQRTQPFFFIYTVFLGSGQMVGGF